MTVTDCGPCLYSEVHGWWGPPLAALGASSHCRKCHRSWSGTKQAHCPVCCAHFSANSTADLHWPRGVHADPATIRDKDGALVLKAVDTKFGSMWVRAGDSQHPAALDALHPHA